jgi:uroporphyrinogen-III synthase
MKPLAGCRVLVTRERPGELAVLLEARGATVVHVPLIEVIEPADGAAALQRELERLDDFDWIVVTSAAGAERVAAAAAASPTVRLAAVGDATARVLEAGAGRAVDLVPSVQRAASLATELVRRVGPTPQEILVAQADRADSELVDRLSAAGHRVTAVVAYRTRLVAPDPAAIEGADALLLASGSAAQAWFDTLGVSAPPIVVAIGPTTASLADTLGLKVTGTATDHSLGGLVTELERILSRQGPGSVDGIGMEESTQIDTTK